MDACGGFHSTGARRTAAFHQRVRIPQGTGGTQFTCFTSTTVQILTEKALLQAKAEAQLEKLEVKLRGVQQVALTSVAGFMSQ